MQANDNNRRGSNNDPSRDRLLTEGQRKFSGKTRQSSYIRKHGKSERSLSELSLESTTTMNRQGERIKPNYREIPLKEMMTHYSPQWLAWIGFLASVAAALQLPMFGYILSQYVFVLDMPIETDDEKAAFEHERNVWTWAFLGLVLGIGLSSFVQKLCFGYGGDNLTLRLRIKLFEAYLNKHIGWFDNKERAPGVLTNIITEDVSAVNGLTTEAIGIMVEAGLGILISSLVCFVFSWRLAIVVTIISPFMIIGGLGMAKL